jgi:hypothetical protein
MKLSHEQTYYPINRMRNIAQCNTVSPWVFVLDTDEMPMFTHDEYAHQLGAAISGMSDEDQVRSVFTLASFQVLHGAGTDIDLSSTEKLVSAGTNKLITCKHSYFPPAYTPPIWVNEASTRIWIKKFGDLTEPLVLPMEDRYEGYYLQRTHQCKSSTQEKEVPFMYDDRFVGWGGNKMSLTRKMQFAHMKFYLLPKLFTFIGETKKSSHNFDETNHKTQRQLYPDLTDIVAHEIGESYCGCKKCQARECISQCWQCFKSNQ